MRTVSTRRTVATARPGRSRLAAGLAAISILAACTACAGSLPVPVQAGTQGAATQGSVSRQSSGSSGCALDDVASIASESSSQLQSQTESWGTVSANAWTVPVPDGSWTADGSNGGFDAQSTDGSDVSVGDSYSQSQLTVSGMENTAFSAVSNMQLVCQTAVASNSTSSTQGTEYTGVYQGQNIHGILVVSVLPPSTTDLWVGDTHSVYTPAAQWSESTAQTLFLIAFEAIETPQES
jgi:hypothetical protein